MTDDDAAYTALLTQLLSDSSSTRNARVHSWIEHQYDFVLSEHDVPSSRSPSPSPSSSLGAHRTFSVDRPDSPLLPRSSVDTCPSYDTLFFPASSSPDILPEEEEREERERARALRFLVQEMTQWKLQSTPATPHRNTDKPLPAPPPPSPATSTTQSTSSRVMRSRSSSTRISRLPSFTSTLSSDQSQPQDVFAPPLPVSVIVHGEPHHELVLRHEHQHAGVYLHNRNDSFPQQILPGKEQEIHFLSPTQDDKDSLFPSPTLSNFSCAYSRETSITTPNNSFPASPASATFAPTGCLPENVALPASPEMEHAFSDGELVSSDVDGNSLPLSPSRTALPVSPTSSVFPSSPSSASFTVSPGLTLLPASSSMTALPVSPSTTVFPASPTSSYFPPTDAAQFDDIPAQSLGLQAQRFDVQSQSRWSVATTASLTPSASEPKFGSFLAPRTPSKGSKDKELKTPRKRTRFISLISRLSPGRSEPSSSATPPDNAGYDSAEESDPDQAKEKDKRRKAPSKKSSLASLRASFSISRTSFASQRPTLASPSEEVPPLPTSPTRTSFSATRISVVDGDASAQAIPPVPKVSSRIPSRATQLDAPLPPIPQSASTITSFHGASQGSLQTSSAASASTSRVSLLPLVSNHSTSKISLLPPPSKRTSLASAAGIEAPVSIHPMPLSTTIPARTKSIFKIPAKSKTPKARTNVPGPQEVGPTPSKLPVPSSATSSPPAVSKIPQAPSKFTPPTKLASVLAGQGPRTPPKVGTASPPPASKLPAPPSRIIASSKIVRPTLATQVSDSKHVIEEVSVATSKLPLPSSTKSPRVGTVKGFWRRQ